MTISIKCIAIISLSSCLFLSACSKPADDKLTTKETSHNSTITAQADIDKTNKDIDVLVEDKMALLENITIQDVTADSQAFLAMNANKTGVSVTDSGLQYRVLTQGTGPKPTTKNIVEVHYRGTFPNGDEFDSSHKRGEPAQFPVTGVIKGWTEALLLMNQGSTYELVIPAKLAYGERGAGDVIPPNQVLKFEIQLLDADFQK